MQSKTLSFKGLFSPALFRNNLSRFWPLWAIYLAVYLITMPTAQFLILFGHERQWTEQMILSQNALKQVLSMTKFGAMTVSLIFGCLFAMALYAYLTTARSVGFFHALPVRREGLFLTHYLTGISVFLSVHMIAALLTLAVWGAAGLTDFLAIWNWFLSATGQMLFFYSFAVFCAMFSGQILAMPVFYGIFNVLATGLMLLYNLLCEMAFYGWSNFSYPDIVLWLSPAVNLINNYKAFWQFSSDDVFSVNADVIHQYLVTVGIYALAGIVLAVFSWFVCQRRKSESAGEIVTIDWAKPIFRYGVGVCAALSLGQLLYEILWDAFGGNSNVSIPVLTLCMLFPGMVGYFAAEMLLQKSFRVLKRGWKGAMALAAALILLCVSFPLDLLGIQKRVPTADNVDNLSFSIYGEDGINGNTTDPELVERFINLHQLVAQEKPQYDWWGDDTHTASVRLDYTLKTGKKLSRTYNFTYAEQEVTESGSVMSMLQSLCMDPDVAKANLNEWLLNSVERLTSAELMVYQYGKDLPIGEEKNFSFNADTARKLLDALEQDMQAGHVGKDIFNEKARNENTYVMDLVFYYRMKNTTTEDRNSNNTYSLQFSRNHTFLLKALKEVGVNTDQLRTFAQQDAMTDGGNKDGYGLEDDAWSDDQGETAVIGGADAPTTIILGDEPNFSGTQEP